MKKLGKYEAIAKDVMRYGVCKPSRGKFKGQSADEQTLVKSLFDQRYYTHLHDGRMFPLLTTKYVSWKNVLVENLWFLSGKREIDFLHKHDVHIWDNWAKTGGGLCSDSTGFVSHVSNVQYIENAYGALWRGPIWDQIRHLIAALTINPYSRRHVLSAWHPIDKMNQSDDLVPCHCFAVFCVDPPARGREVKRLNLHLTQRSCDVAIGLPYNMAGYAFLLCLFARLTGMEARCLAHTIVDAHVYGRHERQLHEQIEREPYDPPSLKIHEDIKTFADVEDLIKNGTTDQLMEAFRMENYMHHPAIRYEVAV